jgi:hypothetical protein
MISVETINPVYSNAGGKTKEQKKQRRARFLDKAKNVYGKASESGILSGVQNLILGGAGGTGTGDTNLGGGGDNEYTAKKEPTPMKTSTKVLIGVGVGAVIFGIYWFAIRKK